VSSGRLIGRISLEVSRSLPRLYSPETACGRQRPDCATIRDKWIQHVIDHPEFSYEQIIA
jgi:hypothetical protein